METMAPSDVDRLARRSRSFAWFAVGLAGVSLALVMVAWAVGGAPHWWALVIPVLLMANLAVTSFRVLRSWPRLEKGYYGVSMVVAITVIIAIARNWP